MRLCAAVSSLPSSACAPDGQAGVSHLGAVGESSGEAQLSDRVQKSLSYVYVESDQLCNVGRAASLLAAQACRPVPAVPVLRKKTARLTLKFYLLVCGATVQLWRPRRQLSVLAPLPSSGFPGSCQQHEQQVLLHTNRLAGPKSYFLGV